MGVKFSNEKAVAEFTPADAFLNLFLQGKKIGAIPLYLESEKNPMQAKLIEFFRNNPDAVINPEKIRLDYQEADGSTAKSVDNFEFDLS